MFANNGFLMPVPRLTGTNYESWKVQLKGYLLTIHCLDHIVGDEFEKAKQMLRRIHNVGDDEPFELPEDVQRRLMEKEESARGVLIMATAGAACEGVQTARTAREA